jgi:Cys-Gly metallodipeptidase DUG1
MTDLIALMGKLVDGKGRILVPGVEEMVSDANAEERQASFSTHFFLVLMMLIYRAIYEVLDYSTGDVEQAAGAPIALSANKVDVLMGRMRSPSLSLHGIEGAFSGVGAKTVIPAKVAGKFSIRYVSAIRQIIHFYINTRSLVPPQTPELVDPLVIAYLHSEFAKLGSKNKLMIENLHGGKPWVADVKHWNFEAAKVATEVSVYSVYFLISLSCPLGWRFHSRDESGGEMLTKN